MIRVFIIGGGRGIGHWFARNMTTQHRDLYETFLCDINFDDDQRIEHAKQILLEDTNASQFAELITDSSIVIFSVPIDKLQKSLEQVGQLLPRGCLVINFSSVQATTNRLINKMINGHGQVIGLHLMFGPGAQSLAGKNVVVTDAEEPIRSNRLKQLVSLMQNEGAYVEYSSADLHDRMMNLMQTLVHFVYLAFAKYLSVSSISPRDLLKFQTLPSAYFFSFVARVMLQGKLTYANIQNQPGAHEAREAFLDTARSLASEISQADDPTSLASHFEKMSCDFDEADLRALFSSTEGSILSFDDDALVFQKLMQSNDLVLVREVGDGSVERAFVGFISENRKDTFVLRRVVFRQASATSENDTKFFFWGDEFEEVGQTAEKWHDLIDQDDLVQNFVELKKSAAHVSTGLALHEWLTKSVVPICRVFDVVSNRFDRSLIVELCQDLEKSDNSIYSAKANEFKIVGDKDVCFKLEIQFFPPLNATSIDELVEQCLEKSFDIHYEFRANR